MTKPKLEFLRNDAGEREGLGDAGIETFRDTPYASCAREAGQNSRDAVAAYPVRLTFDLLEVPREEFPDYSALLDALTACSVIAEDDKEREFFANALKVTERSALPVLRIADYNTTGLTGPPRQPGTPFHSLLKATGVSRKESEDAGGSFGIGKNASFAVSDLQMVFYSTRYEDPETGAGRYAAQGKVKLISHETADGIPRRFTGYWGNPYGYHAVTDPTLVPEWLLRKERGTSIFCAGFRASEDWAEHMTASLISNFFCAIHREEMVFEVDGGRFQINRNTLEALLEHKEVRLAAEQSGHLSDLEFASDLYRCIVSSNADEEILTIRDLGRMRVRLLTEAGLPRRVGFVRNGMLITDNLRHFGHPMMRFPGARDFVMLVEPDDVEAGALLKRLENPSHDGFSAQRIPDPAKRASAERALKKLGKQLRDIIRASAGVEQADSVVLEELGRYFADPTRNDDTRGGHGESNPESHVFEPPRVRKRKRTTPARTKGEEGGSQGEGGAGPGEPEGAGPAFGGGSGGRGSRGRRPSVELADVRNVVRQTEDGARRGRLLHFTPAVGGPMEITVQATGVNAPETLRLISTDTGSLSTSGFTFEASPGQRCSVLITFDEDYDGPLEVGAAEVHV